jgi:hypothetical protein
MMSEDGFDKKPNLVIPIGDLKGKAIAASRSRGVKGFKLADWVCEAIEEKLEREGKSLEGPESDSE